MSKSRKSKAERFTGKAIGQIAQDVADCFIARYSTDAERVAKLVLEKIRASNKHGK